MYCECNWSELDIRNTYVLNGGNLDSQDYWDMMHHMGHIPHVGAPTSKVGQIGHN